MEEILSRLIFLAGFGQLSVLVASALVPIQMNWKEEFAVLSRDCIARCIGSTGVML